MDDYDKAFAQLPNLAERDFAANRKAVSRFFSNVVVLSADLLGGLAEMSLVALSLGVEVAFVAAHHIVRVFIVMLEAAPVFAIEDNPLEECGARGHDPIEQR